MLLPNEKWHWHFAGNEESLMLEMDSGMRFETAYNAKHLCCNSIDLPFSVEHSQTYMDIVDELESNGVPFSLSQISQIALNACAAIHFHKPITHKSFLYQKGMLPFNSSGYNLAWLLSAGDTALILTLEQDGNCVTCLNLSEQFITRDNKSHQQFSVIKTLSDRLTPLDGLEEAENRARKAS